MDEVETSGESDTSLDGEQPKRLPAKVYLVGALTQVAIGMSPGAFLESFIIDMGANFAELGAFRSVGNFAPTVLQPVWVQLQIKRDIQNHS